ncbi:MAG: thiamine pyrophosphate-binding protein, partial [Bacteroidota bacterium]|nr:thiamine pyrophosphate-binding protein [Bacteroidota bacterium]
QISEKIVHGKNNYNELWKELDDSEKHNKFLKNAPWSDFKVFGNLLNIIPDDTVIHLGNSTPVRYAMLFKERKNIEWYSNRGTSGIDGIISTAAGFASVSNKTNTVISGDISFFYDSNALWNKHLPNNLKIIVINNQGGGIFRFIPGPASTGHLEEFFETQQDLNIKKMTEVFDLNYYFCDEKSNFNDILKKVYQPHNKAVVLEIRTHGELNDKVLKDYFNNIKQK